MREADGARITKLAEALADGTPVDWAAAESTAATEQERIVIRRLSRIGLAASLHRKSAPRDTWSHLQLLEKVGGGAFGDVFRAHDPRLARDVALKLLHEPTPFGGVRASAAIEEGRLLARVRHPNVVTVFGAESLNGQVGIWTEFIAGQTLHAIVTKHGPLPNDEVVSIGVHLSAALAAVHDAGLLHRDIKAQNVMRENGGRIVLMDFGTGRNVDPLPGRSRDVSGTPLYLAPELFTGREASVASDVYALAVLLFFLLTGRYPVSGRALKDVEAAHRAGSQASLRELRPDVPGELVEVIERGLAREPRARFGSAREFERALVALVSPGIQPVAHTRGAAIESWRRHRLVTAMGIGAVGLAILWWSLTSDKPNGSVAGLVTDVAVAPAGPSAASDSSPAKQPAEGHSLDDRALPAPPRAHANGRISPVTSERLNDGAPRVLLTDFPDWAGSVSADGRWLAQTDVGGGDLAIRDLATLKVSRLGLKAGPSAGVADLPAFSRDTKLIAYRWMPDQSRRADLNSVGPRPGPPAVLGVVDARPGAGAGPRQFSGDFESTVQWVHDWSTDGRVLVTLAGPGGRQRLAWVSTTDGSVTTLKEFESSTIIVGSARVSPDDKYIAYAAREPAEKTEAGPGRQFIYVLPTDGRPPEPLVTAGWSLNPIWSPDGTRLLYTNDESAMIALWCVAVVDGRADGARQRLTTRMHPGSVIGITGKGQYYYRPLDQDLNQFFIVAASDGPAASLRTRPVAEHVGRRPTWSPDGQHIAYLKPRAVGSTEETDLYVLTIKDGFERLVRRNASFLPMRWLDSGTVLEQRPGAVPFRQDLYRIDVATHKAEKLGAELEPGLERPFVFALSADGQTLYTAARGAGGKGRPWDRLVKIDVASGRATSIFSLPPDLTPVQSLFGLGLAVSPSGRELAVAIQGQQDRKARLFRIGVDGAGYQELYEPYWTGGAAEKVAWTTDGIYFSEGVVSSDPQPVVQRWRVMRIAPEGGAAQLFAEINGSDMAATFDVSPDGSRLAFHPSPSAKQSFSASAGPRRELWVFELAAALEAVAVR